MGNVISLGTVYVSFCPECNVPRMRCLLMPSIGSATIVQHDQIGEEIAEMGAKRVLFEAHTGRAKREDRNGVVCWRGQECSLNRQRVTTAIVQCLYADKQEINLNIETTTCQLTVQS